MPEIQIELGHASDLDPCECCGGRTRIVRAFVYVDQTARAFYIVRWAPGRPQHDALLAVSIGGWCEADADSERCCIALEHRMVEGRPTFMVVDAQATFWSTEKALGRPVSRTEALASSLAKEAFDILDAAMVQDSRVNGWLLDRATNLREIPAAPSPVGEARSQTGVTPEPNKETFIDAASPWLVHLEPILLIECSLR